MPRQFQAVGSSPAATGARRGQPALTVASAASLIGTAAVVVAFLLPLLVLPGAERPFSTPKIALLGFVVTAGAVWAACFRWLCWPALPGVFQAALVMWLAALGASAAFGLFASLSALLLPLFAAGWFLLLLVVRPGARQLNLALAASGGVVACLALLQYVGLDPFAASGWTAVGGSDPRMRVFATLGNPNFVAAFLVAVLPLTASLRNRFERRRWLFALMLVVQALAIFATGSRAAVLGLAGALLWVAVLRGARGWRTPAVVAVLVSVLLLAVAPSRHLATTLRGRFYIWQVVATHLGERPLLGFGLGAFRAKYAEWETERWTSGHASDREREFAGFQDHAHNDYLEIAVDQGAAGLVSFLTLLTTFLVFAFRQSRRAPSGYLTSASAGVVALVAVALVDFPLQRPTELFVFWTLMAVVYLAAGEESCK